MTSSLRPAPAPEEEELACKRDELSKLQEELCRRELEIATLNAEVHSFGQRYYATVGRRYAELDNLNALIAAVHARRHPGDRAAQDAAFEARRAADDAEAATRGMDASAADHAFTPTERLKKLYRDAAKGIHPDLATDEAGRRLRERAMQRLNQAFEDCDEAAVAEILREWQSSPDQVDGDDVGAELVRTIRRISQARKRIEKITSEIAEVGSSELFQLKTRVEEAQKQGRDLLAEMIATLDRDIQTAKHNLNAIEKEARHE
ncbi:MAG: hypothetical protein K8T91_05980 [Planctomycetes bacterium]|nr:hypothetical protein [Planctomycetota bacterium]